MRYYNPVPSVDKPGSIWAGRERGLPAAVVGERQCRWLRPGYLRLWASEYSAWAGLDPADVVAVARATSFGFLFDLTGTFGVSPRPGTPRGWRVGALPTPGEAPGPQPDASARPTRAARI